LIPVTSSLTDDEGDSRNEVREAIVSNEKHKTMLYPEPTNTSDPYYDDAPFVRIAYERGVDLSPDWFSNNYLPLEDWGGNVNLRALEYSENNVEARPDIDDNAFDLAYANNAYEFAPSTSHSQTQEKL
jgi:hypothetical protein